MNLDNFSDEHLRKDPQINSEKDLSDFKGQMNLLNLIVTGGFGLAIFIFAIVTIFSLFEKIEVHNNYFIRKSLFENKKVYFKDISKISIGYSGKYITTKDDLYYIFWDSQGRRIAILNPNFFQFFKKEQIWFFNFISEKNPNIQIDSNCFL